MTTLEMPLNFRKLNKFIKDYSALVIHFRREMKAIFDAKALNIIEKYATSKGEYQGYAHYAFYDNDDKLILGLVLDIYSREVKITELPRKNGTILMVEPKNIPERRMNIFYSSKAKK